MNLSLPVWRGDYDGTMEISVDDVNVFARIFRISRTSGTGGSVSLRRVLRAQASVEIGFWRQYRRLKVGVTWVADRVTT